MKTFLKQSINPKLLTQLPKGVYSKKLRGCLLPLKVSKICSPATTWRHCNYLATAFLHCCKAEIKRQSDTCRNWDKNVRLRLWAVQRTSTACLGNQVRVWLRVLWRSSKRHTGLLCGAYSVFASILAKPPPATANTIWLYANFGLNATVYGLLAAFWARPSITWLSWAPVSRLLAHSRPCIQPLCDSVNYGFSPSSCRRKVPTASGAFGCGRGMGRRNQPLMSERRGEV